MIDLLICDVIAGQGLTTVTLYSCSLMNVLELRRYSVPIVKLNSKFNYSNQYACTRHW